MPRKEKLDETTDQEITQEIASVPEDRNTRSKTRSSFRKVKEIPLAQIIHEGETDKQEPDLPQFMPANESPAPSDELGADELDFAIRQARSEAVPDKSTLDYWHKVRKFAPGSAARANLLSADVSQPPIMVLAASIIMIIVFRAFS